MVLGHFASAMDGLLTPRAQPWHNLKASDPALNELDEVRDWFGQAEEIFFGLRYAPAGNYASKQHAT